MIVKEVIETEINPGSSVTAEKRKRIRISRNPLVLHLALVVMLIIRQMVTKQREKNKKEKNNRLRTYRFLHQDATDHCLSEMLVVLLLLLLVVVVAVVILPKEVRFGLNTNYN